MMLNEAWRFNFVSMDTVRNIILNVNITLNTDLVSWYSICTCTILLGGVNVLTLCIHSPLFPTSYIFHESNLIMFSLAIPLLLCYNRDAQYDNSSSFKLCMINHAYKCIILYWCKPLLQKINIRSWKSY